MAEGYKRSRWPAAGAVLAGLVIGAASGWWSVSRGMFKENYSGWYGSSTTGSVDADPWLRARVAVSGLLALNKSQAIYFTRKTDDSGQPLREQCRYMVSGGAMPGRWWSVTVYAQDNYLPMNDDGALSFDATEVQVDAQGQWSALLAAQRPEQGAAWASTRNAGQFDITLRIYQPAEDVQDDLSKVPMPKVNRLECGGAA